MKTFAGRTRTPCGWLKATSSPASYCAGTIFWPVTSDDGSEAYTFARLGYLALAAHEFGHHLQATTGMLPEYATRYGQANRQGRYELSRRLELQAECFEGVFLGRVGPSVKLTARDRVELRFWHSYTGDEDARQPEARSRD